MLPTGETRAVAAIMELDRTMRNGSGIGNSVYDDRDLLVL
jgi:hypothetical protein